MSLPTRLYTSLDDFLADELRRLDEALHAPIDEALLDADDDASAADAPPASPPTRH